MTDDMPMHARVTPLSDDADGGSRARGTVVGAERERLRTSFGRMLWEQRVARGWSQRALARRAGLHPWTVGAYERGECRPTDVSCHALAAALVADAGGDAVDTAVLALDLANAAGESFRPVHRRRPLRKSRVRAYELARQRRADNVSEELDVMMGAAIAALDLPLGDDELWGDNRPAVRGG